MQIIPKVFQWTIGIFQWTLVVVSVAGTLALFAWIFYMFFKKER